MKRSDWLGGLRTSLGFKAKQGQRRRKRAEGRARSAKFEVLEDRRLLAVDFGDAPDIGPGTGPGNYNTLSTDNGAQHTIVVGLRLGANVDGDGGALQNAAANADDINGALPDDEDGLINPAADLVLTVGAQPTVSVRATNTTGSSAILYGWIDYDANGVFENATERSAIGVANGTNNGIVTLVFPAVPAGFTGTTYARFRLSTDVAAANSTGVAADGEVEDYRVSVTKPSSGTTEVAKSKKIGSSTNGGPVLANSDYFGRAVAAIGDVDGDGVIDLAVGANGDDVEAIAGGAINVLLMNQNGTVKSVQKVYTFNIENGDYFGSSIASVGDLDGDGVPDLAIGSERDDNGGPNRGLVSIVYLNSNGSRKTWSEVESGDVGGLANGDYFGRSVASVGDLDGDGVADLAVGAYGDDTGGANRGAVHVLFMNANGSVKSRQKVASGTGGGPTLANSDKFGSSLANLGDMDGDGISDLAVGAIYDDAGGANRGAVHVLLMNSNGTVKATQKIASGVGGGPTLADGDQFGASLASLGDLDGDGVTDLAVGANYDDTGGTSRGAVHVLFMNANGTVKASNKIASGINGGPTLANDDRFGASIASMGDLDGDGLADLFVGANFDDTGGTNRGAVYSLFSAAANTNPVFTSSTTASVAENTALVLTVTATDTDLPAQAVTFSILGGADQSKFSITSGGVLSFNVTPDYEAPTDVNGDNVYIVTVQASDGVGGFSSQTISVTVTGVNDNSPVFTSPSTVSVPENSTQVMTITAIDGDLPAQGATTFSAVVVPGAPAGFVTTDLRVSFSGQYTGAQLLTPVLPVGSIYQNGLGSSVPPNSALVNSFPTLAFDTFTAQGSSTAGGPYGDPSLGGGAVDLGGSAGAVFSDVQINQAWYPPGGVTIADQVDFLLARITLANTINSPIGAIQALASAAGLPSSTQGSIVNGAVVLGPSVTFSIVGGVDAAKFSLTSGGSLSFISPPDFHAPTDANADNIYQVMVQASDGAGSSATQSISINVTSVTDYGDAPDSGVGTNPGNYNTRHADNGPSHTIVNGLRLGASLDSDSGGLQNLNASADDVGSALPDDEDGLADTAADLVLTVGAQPTVNLRATNLTGSSAMLYGWIDYNGNGVFENATERASVAVANGSNNGIVTLVFPVVPQGAIGESYARFRLSSDIAAANPTGEASGGEIEDYRVTIQIPNDGTADSTKTQKIASGTNGGPTLANTSRFGSAIASLGDLDGDGVEDLAVGAQGDASGGAVHILLMNANGTVKQSQRISSGFGGGPSLASGDYFGRSVAAIGDLDGDGVGDVAVGADRDNTGGSVRGTVYIVFLNANGTAKGFQKIAHGVGGGPSLADGDRFGSTASGIGDLDGDGLVDLLVGANGDDTGGADRGAAYVLLLNADGTVKASQKIASGIGGGPVLSNGDNFGRSTASIGDMDGDGITDLAIGAHRDSTGGTQRGAVYVLFMNANGTVKGSQKIASGVGGGPALSNSDLFGRSLESLGDLDGDGVTDLAVGAFYDDTGGANRGSVQVLFLNSNGTVKRSQKLANLLGGGPALVNGDYFGSSIARVGDLDGDGVTELAVGAEGDDTGGASRGAVHVLFLKAYDYGDAPDPAAGTGTTNYNTLSTDNGPRHGIVAGLRIGAHVDADGGGLQNAAANADDVHSAVPDDEDGLANPGTDLVLTVGSQPNVNVRVTNTTGSGATLYGWIDYNANGVFDNVTERASAAVSNGTNNGIVTLVFPAVPAGFVGTTYARFRLSTDVAAASSTGIALDGEVEDYRATILMPSSGNVDSSKTKKIASGTGGGPLLGNGDQFGVASASIGDLDGDGVNDLLVGAERDDTGGTDRGAAYVFLMNADGTVKSSQKIASGIGGGPALLDGDRFGRAVAALGDLDGDGVIEVVVGTRGDDTSGTNRGAVHVLFLNANGTVKRSQKIASGVGGGPALANGDLFGASVDSLGDLDGDGVSDLVVGADYDDGGGSDRGAVHVLFLKSDGTVKSSQRITSGVGGGPVLANGDLFGHSVASLGDLDNDGITDLVVGSVSDDTAGSNRGAIHVLFMNSNGTVKSTQKIASGVGGGPSLANSDAFGVSAARMGDLDGDGVNDLAVGAINDDTGGPDRGAIYLFNLNANGTVKSTRKIAHETSGGPTVANGDVFGRSVAWLGDLDGDGLPELAAGASLDDTNGTDRGAVRVLYLKDFNNIPVIISPNMASVPENTSAVMTVTATDVDLPAQVVTFAIVGGADQARFSITMGGALSFNSTPNFEAPTDSNGDNIYVVTVEANDGNGGSVTQTISVTVTPVNDNIPLFTSSNVATVPENSSAVLTVTATDADLPAQLVTFSIVGGTDQAKFGITSGGALSFSSAPNFEVPTDANGDNVYVVTVQASDGNGGFTTQTINVSVTPVNDNDPVFTSPDTASVAENSTAVRTVTATDADLPAQALTYSIVGGVDQSKFTITSGGALSFLSAPNFEAPTDANGDNVYVVIVQASDGTRTSVQAILVTVTGLNDNNPVFTSTTTASVPENTAFVKTVTATDADLPAQTLTYSLVGGADQAKFAITSGGALSFSPAPNFDVPGDANGDNVYVVTVQSSDGNGGTSTQTLNVTVTPVNDLDPVFTSPDTANVPENTTLVRTVTATDGDLPAQSVTFSIVGGADQGKFGITSGGVLSFNSAPNFEFPTDTNGDNVYVVIVRASDGSLTSLQAILVTVTDVIEPASGDYNQNGKVDAADYTVWRDSLSASVTPFAGADGSGNGIIDQADYDVWKANFGAVATGSGGAAILSTPSNESIAEQLPSMAELSKPAESLAGSVDAVDPSLLLGSVYFVERAKPHSNGMRASRRELPAVAADKALLAWLAAKPAEFRNDQLTTRSPFSPSARELSDSADRFEDSLDIVFETLGV